MNIFSITKIAVAVALGLAAAYVYADWTAPTFSPPACPSSNPACQVPLNVSVADQIKDGGLGIIGRFITKNKAIIGYGSEANPGIADSLKLRIYGKVGAEAYCDQQGNNCIVPPGGGGGSTTTGDTFWRQIGTSKRIENTNEGRVEIRDKIKILGGEPGKNKVLASNNEGVGNWKTLAELGAIEGFTASCGAGKAIQSIDIINGTVTCVNIPNSTSGGGGLFNLFFDFTSGGTSSGGTCYSTSCSTDNRDITCRIGYVQSQVSACGYSDPLTGAGYKKALCCPK